MKRLLLFFALVLASCAHADRSFSLSDLEGAWWSDVSAQTADFAIYSGEIWLDHDGQFRPVRIEKGNILIYDLGPDLGTIERRIVSLEKDSLVLENQGELKIRYFRKR